MNNYIIIHYGEIGLKGKNQADFLRRLQSNIKTALSGLGLDLKVSKHYGYYSVDLSEQSEAHISDIIQLLNITPGISWFAVMQRIDRESIEKSVVSLAKDTYVEGNSFVVRVNRSDKSYPKTSNELERDLGATIIDQTDWEHVSLKNADQTFYIAISPPREGGELSARGADNEGVYGETYIYTERHRGIGGLPVGSSGKVLSLLSGGIDSPVASFLMTKRGASVDFIHFTATPMQHKEATQYKVSKLVEKLSKTTLNSTLHLIPYTHYQLATMEHRVDYDLVMFRRFMVRVAQTLAAKHKHEALVTGDNLAQVASQTLPNIVSTDKAVNMPILRPLLGYDKIEIIDLAKKIDTYELSIEDYKDCCSIVSKNPRTNSDHDKLEEIEKSTFADYDGLIKQTLKDATVLQYKNGKLVSK